jgi:serine/threonine-protein kinase
VDTYSGLTSGTVLEGRYRVGALIARGGMSMVYRGVDLRLDRPVAIKVMSPQYVSDPAFLSRFEREARLAASLGHSGVVAVYDQGRDGDLVFLVMELVDGGTLRDLLREQGSLSVPVTMSIMEPLLAALGAAHAAGLVHRDVKPENVLISAQGSVKIADFGLVRAVSSQTMATGDVILGTVAYLSPEQVATGTADARSDVYAAGVMAYEMLTGHPPFSGDNPMSVAYQHVHSDVPRCSGNAPGTPEALDDLIVAATRRDPAARPRDANAFLAALAGIRSQLGLRRVAVPVPRRRTAPAAPVPMPAFAGQAFPGPVGGPGPGGTRVLAGGPVTTVPPTVGRQLPPTSQQPVQPGATVRSPTVALRRLRRRRWIIAIVVVLLLGLAAAAGGWWIGGRWAATPAAVGLAQADAENLIRDAGLVPRVITEHHNDVPPGLVAVTDPVAGTEQLRGSEVDLLVSTGRPQVPSIPAGIDTRAAMAALTAADLTAVVAAKPAYDDTVPAGAVLRTDPAAGTAMTVGAQVTLLLSGGPGAHAVPDVRGQSTKDAVKSLEKAGFTVTVGDPAFDADIDAGDILRTDPGPGAKVDPNDAKIFLVPSNAVQVPDLTDSTVAQAQKKLDKLGLRLSVTALFGGGDASIWTQSPGAGGRVEPGGTVSASAFP